MLQNRVLRLKRFRFLAAMDDGFIDENTKINIGGISWTYYSQKLQILTQVGHYDISDILAQSSNIGAKNHHTALCR